MPVRSDLRWLFVSRPVLGSALDGGPALLRELIPALPAEPICYFGDPRRPLRRLGHDDEVIRVPRLPGRLSTGPANELVERAAMAAALLTAERRRQPLHLFFDAGPLTERIAAGLIAAPQAPRSSTSLATRASSGARSLLSVARSLLRVEHDRTDRQRRPAPVVQTLTCSTGLETCAHMLGVLDAVVALSDDTRSRLLAAGVAGNIVHRIHPGVRPGNPIVDASELTRRRAILYAGELDTGATDRLIELARALNGPVDGLREWKLIIACRPDDLVDRDQRIRLGRELAGAIGSGRVELHGEVPDLRALQRRCGLQVWLADKVHRRLDLPLVLVDGLACGLPLVSLDRAPICELFAVADQRKRDIGRRIDPSAPPHVLVSAIAELAASPDTLLRLSADASSLAGQAFSSARMAADYTALHRELSARVWS